MANSSIIDELKTSVITEIINDETLFHAIDSPTIGSFQDSDQLVNKHLFRFHQNPELIQENITFLTFQVHIQKLNNNNWVRPTIEIWIFSHNSHMIVANIPKITADRNDYISMLLDKKFNGRDSLGVGTNQCHLIGKLDLRSNIEGAFNQEFLYRRMIFETRDINDLYCGL